MPANTKVCKKCDKEFKAGDSVLNAMGNAYHSQCFVCHKCGHPFASGSFVMDSSTENPLHENCSTVKAMDDDGDDRDLGDCPVCHKALRGTEPVVTIGQGSTGTKKQKYHQRCFVCGKCHKPFEGTSYFVENGKPCHTDCIGTDMAQTAVNTLQDDKNCHGCGKPLEAQSSRRFVDGMGHFHPGCFKCSSCDESIEGRFFVHPTTEKPICKSCGENL